MRWSISLAAHEFTIKYRLGIKKDIPESLLKCIYEGHQDSNLHEDIPKLEADEVLSITRS